jgi:hypothetical protein
MITTVNLKAVFCGTELHVVQEGVPDVIPEQACYLLAGVAAAACPPGGADHP